MAEPAGFRDFYQANYGRVVACVTALTGDQAEAEDVAQEAFARALAHWSRLSGYDMPEAWVRRVALRIATDGMRRLRRAIKMTGRLSAQRTEPAAGPDDAFGFTDLGAALRVLPLAQREVLVLFYLADLSVGQIAQEKGLSPGAVKARLLAGRRRLERELSSQPAEVRHAR